VNKRAFSFKKRVAVSVVEEVGAVLRSSEAALKCVFATENLETI